MSDGGAHECLRNSGSTDIAAGLAAPAAYAANSRPKREPLPVREERRNPVEKAVLEVSWARLRPTNSAEKAEKRTAVSQVPHRANLGPLNTCGSTCRTVATGVLRHTAGHFLPNCETLSLGPS